MKRFLLFQNDYYYPAGGWDDFKGDFDTAEEAFAGADTDHSIEWRHVIDTTTMKEVDDPSDIEGKTNAP